MAVNLSSYIRNLGKSVGYSAIYKIKKMNPTMVNLIETNEDLTKDLYKNVKNYKSILRNVPKAIKENEYYRIAEQGLKNTLSDLSTGKFYNVERIAKADLKLMGITDEDNALSDFGLDDDFGFSDFDLDSIGDDDIFLANQMDDVGEKTSTAIASATLESANYIANTNRASTKMLIDQNNKMMGQITVGMGAINNSIQQMIQFQENMQVHIENSTTFYDTIGEKVDTTNKILSELLELEKKRSSEEEKNDYKSNTITYSDIDDGNGGVDLKLYFKSVKKRLKSQTGGMFDMFNAFSGGNMLETMVASPLQFITDKFVDKLIDTSVKEANKSLDRSLKGLFGSLVYKANYMANESSSAVFQKIGEILGVTNRLKRNIDVSKYQKGPMQFNGKANKAITEVIPTQLAEIISILNGKSQQLFDYNLGKFTTREKIQKDKEADLNRQGVSAASDVINELKGMMDKMSFDSLELKETIRKDIVKMFQDAFKSGTFLDIYDKEFDLPGITDLNSKRYIKSMLKNVSRSKMLALNSNIMSGRDRYTRQMQDRELNGSIYSYLEDGFDYGHLVYKTNKNRSLLSELSIANAKDNLGHNIFFYLQNINNELSYIRSNGTLGQGSNGGYRDEYFTSRGIVTRDALPPVFKNNISDESEKAKNARIELDRDIARQRQFNEKKLQEREKDPSLLKTEELDKLEGIEFDRAITSAANNFFDDKKLHINRKFYGAKTFIDDLLAAQTISAKSKVIVENIKDIAAQPSKLIASAMDSADRALYTIIYGDKRDKDGKRKSFLNEMIEQMKFQFLKVNNWIDETILNPVKEKLKIEDFRDIPDKIFGMFGIDIHETMDNFKRYVFGKYEIDGNGKRVRVEDGLLTPIAKGIEDTFDEFGKFLDDVLSPIIDPIKNAFKGKENQEDTGEIISQDITTTTNSTQNATSQVVNNITDRSKRLSELSDIRSKTAVTSVNGKNSYNLAGGYVDKLNYEKLDKDIKKYQKPEYYSNPSNRTVLQALLEEKEKYKTYSELFGNILGDKKEGKRATSLLLQELGSKGIDINDLTLEEIYQNLLHLGEFTVMNNGKETKGGFYRTYKGKQLIKRFDSFANDAIYFDIYNNIGDRNKTKLRSVIDSTKGLDVNNLQSILNPIKPEIITANNTSQDDNLRLRDSRQIELEQVFSSLDENIGNANSKLIDELKGIHDVTRNIYNKLSRLFITPLPIRNDDNIINVGQLENYAHGGIVNYSKDTVVPALLSGGEIVINPADKKTRKEQAKREERVRDLFLNGKINLLSEGANITEDGEVKPLEGGVEDIVNGKKVKVYDIDGRKFVKIRNHFYDLEEYKEKGKFNSVEYYYSSNGELTPVKTREQSRPWKDLVSRVERNEYKEGEEPLLYRTVNTLSTGLKDTTRALGITKDDSENFNKAVGDVMSNISEYAPAAVGSALIGSGVSLVTGAIGGPLLGAAAGAAIGLIRKSDKVQTWLFGEQDSEGEYSGGFLSKELSNNINKYLPGMAKSATLGGIVSILPFVPGGPIAGIMLGSAIGYAKNNEEFMNTIFGENYKDNIDSFKTTLNKKMPNLLLGAAGGALFGPLGGLIPNIVLGSAMGFATSTNKFNELLFGKELDDGTREGGILNAVKVGIVDPIKENGKNLWENITNWVHDDIIIPIKDSIDPLFKQSTLVITKVFGGLVDSIANTFDNGVNYVIGNFLKSKIFDPMMNDIVKVGSALFAPAKSIISSPFRAIGAVGDHFRKRHIAGGNATYMSAQERLDYRQDQRQKKQNSFFGRIGTGINTLFNRQSNPISRLLNSGNSIRGDKFEQFDDFLVKAKDEELGQMRDQLKLLTNSEDYYKEESAKALEEQRSILHNNLNYDDAEEITIALQNRDYNKAKHIIDNIDMDEFDRQKLIKRIFGSAARLNSVQQAVSDLKGSQKDVLDSLRNHKSGVFKGLKNMNDLSKYKKYLDQEIANRGKSDIEIQTDQQKEHHTELMHSLTSAISYLKIIADPDKDRREEQLEFLRNREMQDISKAVNTKASLFSGMGLSRNYNSKIFDIATDDKGRIKRDKFNNPIYEYVGYGSMEHAYRNPDLYDVQRDQNGNIILDDNNNPILNLDENGRPVLLSDFKTTKANVFNLLHMSKYKKKDLYNKYSTKYTIEDMVKYNNTNNSDLKTQLQEYMNKYNIVNVDLDRELTQTITENDAKKLLNKLQFTRWKNKDREKLYTLLNEGNIYNQLKAHYDNKGETVDDDNIMSMIRNANDNTPEEKRKWYMFDGVRRLRMKYDSDGNPVIDREDAETSENIEDIEKVNAINEDTLSAVVQLKDNVAGAIKRFLGFADYRDSDKETIWDKIKKVTGGVMGAWTMLSFAPHIKKFWVETVAPYLGEVFSPIQPTLEKMSLKLDNFFMNTVPNTLKDIGNNIIWWLSGTGKYTNAGLPGVFRDHIIPFYMGGIEFLAEDIMPTLFKYLPSVLTSVAKGAVKILANILSTNISAIFRGEVPTLENLKDDTKSTLDQGIFKKTTHKTGPFYSLYKNMFGSSSSDNSTITTGTVYDTTVNSTGEYNKLQNTENTVKNSITKLSNMVWSDSSNNEDDVIYVDQNNINNIISKYGNSSTSNNVTEAKNNNEDDVIYLDQNNLNRIMSEYSSNTNNSANYIDNAYINATTGYQIATPYENSYNSQYYTDTDVDVEDVVSTEPTDYNYILNSTVNGDAVYDNEGNLIYNSNNKLIKQDAKGNLYDVTPVKTSSNISNDTNNTDDLSTWGYIQKGLNSFKERGTVGNATGRAFLSGNAGLATTLAKKIQRNGGRLIKAKSLVGRVAVYPVNTFAKYSSYIINNAATAGKLTQNFITDRGFNTTLQSAIDQSVVRDMQKIGNGTILDYAQRRTIQNNAYTAAIDQLRSIGNSEQSIMRNVQKIGDDVTSTIERYVSEETGEVALKKTVKSRLNSIAAQTFKFAKLAVTNLSEYEWTKKLISLSDDLCENLLERLVKKGVSKIATFLGKFSPVALAFIALDASRGWANAQANLGIMRAPSIPERLISALVTAINGYATLGLVPETFIYKLAIETIGPLIGLGDELLAEREEAKQEVAEYNSKYGTSYTVDEYILKDRTGIAKFLWGGGEKQEVETKASTPMNYALSMAQSTNDKSYIIGNSLSQAQLQYAKDTGLYASGTGLPLTSLPIANSAISSTFISQTDPSVSWMKFNTKNDTIEQTIGSSGCVPAASAMVVSDLKRASSEDSSSQSASSNNYFIDAIKMAKNPKYKQTNGGVNTSFTMDYFKNYGIDSTTTYSSTDVINAAKEGTPLEVLGRDVTNKSKEKSPFGANTHAVTITGASKDGKYLYVNDPELNTGNVVYSTNSIVKGMQVAVIPKYNSKNDNAFPTLQDQASLGVGKVNKDSNLPIKVSSSTTNLAFPTLQAKATLGSAQSKKEKETTKPTVVQTIYNDEALAMQYADLCTFSTISKTTCAKALKKLLKAQKMQKTSIFKDMSDIFLIASKETGFDPRFLIALALYMTSYGSKENKFTRAKNPYAIKHINSNRYVHFKDIEDGIIEGAKYIKSQIYLNGKYCLKQMSMDKATKKEAGSTTLRLTDSGVIAVVNIMLNEDMPKNTKFASYDQGPTNTQAPDAIITGQRVYNKDSLKDGEINSISEVKSIFTKLANAIFGFKEEEIDPYDLDSLQDTDEGDKTLKDNGHSFLCYCKECHPEMYDNNGNPITSQALGYTMSQKAEEQVKLKESSEKLSSATKQVASLIYDTLVDQLEFNKGSDPISLIKNNIDYTKLPPIADKMAKFTIMASEDSTVPGIKLAKDSDAGVENGVSTGIASIANAIKSGNTNTYLSTNANKFYNTQRPLYIKGGVGHSIDYSALASVSDAFGNSAKSNYTDYKSIYNSLLWYYKDRFGVDYKPTNTLYTDSDYYRELSNIKKDLISRFKITSTDTATQDETLFKYLTGKLGDSNIKLGYDSGSISTMLNRRTRSILEDTATFKKSSILSGDSTLKLYPVTKPGQVKPLYYLAEGDNLNSSKNVFRTNLLGVPVYGVNTRNTTSREDAMVNNSGSPVVSYFKGLGHDIYTYAKQVPRTYQYLYYSLTGNEKKQTEVSDKMTDDMMGIYEKTSKSWKDLTTEDIVSVYGLSKASTILDQYNTSMSKEDETDKTQTTDTSEDTKVSGVVADSTNSVTATSPTSAYIYDKYGNLVEYSLDETDLAAYNSIYGNSSTTDSTLSEEYSGQGSGLLGKRNGNGSFISQLDPKYSNIRFNTSKDSQVQTLGESGCAPAVATMAINNYLGNGTNMIDMANSALGYKVKNGGTSSDYFEDVFAQNGISSSYTDNVNDIKNKLKNGNSVVLLGQDKNNTSKMNSPFGPGNHYVLANGISKDGRTVYINDPELDQENVPYDSSILNSTNLGIGVGGSSKLSRYVGEGSYTKETASVEELRARNLGKFSKVTEKQLNAWINSKAKKTSLMYNTGKYFIEASKKSGLDPRYLVAHAACETGWGTSNICRDKFNFFGISAFDASPYASASKWGGVKEGIIQGAIWISKNYYHKNQTTLYTMRHNNGVHQYATAADWDITIATIMQSGPINTSGTSSKKILSKINNSSSTTDEDTTESSTSTEYSSLDSMISSVFSNLSNAIFGFSTQSEEVEENLEDTSVGEDSTEKSSDSSSSSKSSETIRYINASSVNTYGNKTDPISSAPEQSKDVRETLKYGTKVTLIKDYGTISKIKYKKKGYIKSSYLQTTAPSSTEVATKNTSYRYVQYDNTKMYKYKLEPTSGAPEQSKHILLTLNKGFRVELIKDYGTVSKVKFIGSTGYVKSNLLGYNLPSSKENVEKQVATNKAISKINNTIKDINTLHYKYGQTITTTSNNTPLYNTMKEAYNKKNTSGYTFGKNTKLIYLSNGYNNSVFKVKTKSGSKQGYIRADSLNGSGSGLSNKSLYYSPYNGHGSAINKSNYNGNGIEEILAPFNKFGKIFGWMTETANTSTTATSSDDSSDSSLKLDSSYSKTYKDFTFTNNTSDLGNAIVAEAKKHLGKPYVWGANGPNSFDCSGLCRYVYAKCGINLKNRVSTYMAQDNQGKPVTKISVGDLVFFSYDTTLGKVHHVGIYIGNGKYIHSPKKHDVVKIANLADRKDLVLAKHYTKSSGSGSNLPLVDKIAEMATTNPYMEDDTLNTYMETLYGNGSNISKTNTNTIIPKTRNNIVGGSTSKVSLDDSTITQLLELCCKSMSKTADNTDSLKTIVTLLTKLIEKKTSKGGSSTIKVESSGKGSSKSTNNSTIIVNNTMSKQESNDSAEQLIELLTRLASE